MSARGGLFGMLTVALTALLVSSVPPIPPLLVAYGRYAVTWRGSHGEFIYVGEGMNSSMAVSREASGALNYHNAGKVQASSLPQDMRLQRMLGHLTTLVPENPKSVLVIGCGAGVTAGAVSISPIVESVVIAEIEPLVPEVVSTYFSEHNYDVVRNPKVHVQIDDARHYLLTSDRKFDAITSDPFDPWVKGAATLYTKEFFQVIKDHLNPGGVVTVFVQLYESGGPAVKSEIATFLEVFPNGMIFGNTHQGGGYDVVLLGQNGDAKINVDLIEQRLADPKFAAVAQSLSEIGFYNGVDLLSTFAAQGPQLQPWLADAQVNRDRNLRLQYLAGLGVNKYEQAQIYSEILQYRSVPPNLFIGCARSTAGAVDGDHESLLNGSTCRTHQMDSGAALTRCARFFCKFCPASPAGGVKVSWSRMLAILSVVEIESAFLPRVARAQATTGCTVPGGDHLGLPGLRRLRRRSTSAPKSRT